MVIFLRGDPVPKRIGHVFSQQHRYPIDRDRGSGLARPDLKRRPSSQIREPCGRSVMVAPRTASCFTTAPEYERT